MWGWKSTVLLGGEQRWPEERQDCRLPWACGGCSSRDGPTWEGWRQDGTGQDFCPGAKSSLLLSRSRSARHADKPNCHCQIWAEF